jgi:hypothetical protein
MFVRALLFSFLLHAPAHAKMMAQKHVPAAKLAAYLEKQKKSRALGALEAQALALAQLGRELGAEIPRPYTESEEESLPLLGPADVAASFHSSIPADWNSPSPKALKLMRKNRKLLESYLGSRSPYDWAWVRYELGEKKEAKAALNELFGAEFEKTMKLEKSVNAFGHGPLTDAERFLVALKPMSSKEEAAELDARMQKMKVHVSNLPQSTILT